MNGGAGLVKLLVSSLVQDLSLGLSHKVWQYSSLPKVVLIYGGLQLLVFDLLHDVYPDIIKFL